tara:strand:+ start:1306 stop:1524 length:219 start_codon:yes stop_codon:yes gene_type:complete
MNMSKKYITVTKESNTGRNQQFQVTPTGEKMTRAQLVREIRNGDFPDYHVRTINGIATPVSNPDGSKKNNLG